MFFFGTLTIKFDGDIIKINIYDAMKYPCESNPIFVIDVINSLMKQNFELNDDDALKVAITSGLDQKHV